MGDAKSVRRNVAVFLDMENLVGGTSSEATGLRLGELVAGIENIVRKTGVGSRTAVVRAYAHWGHVNMARFQREILENGIEPVQIFSFDKNVKNAADIELCVDVLSIVHESPGIDVIVIATGDGGFIPLIRRLHALNKYVIVVSTNDPGSGVVNKLLKSVADEYHQVPMSRVSATSQVRRVSAPATVFASPAKAGPNVSGTTPKQKKQKPAAKKVPKASQSLLVETADIVKLRDAIFSILHQHPEFTVQKRVIASSLGSCLRKEWPHLSYKACGSKSLSSFLKKHCSLEIIKAPEAQKQAQVVVLPVPTAESVRDKTELVPTATQEFFVEAVRKQFTDGSLGHDVKASGMEGLKLSFVGSKLRTAITGYSSPNAGFPLLHQVLDCALTATEYRVRFEASGAVVVHSLLCAGSTG